MNLPVFSEHAPATLLRARPAAAEQAFLEVRPRAGFAERHERAGQFCKIRVGAVEGIFAMYSAPPFAERGGDPTLARFLVRTGNPDGGEAADALAALPDGAPIEMTLPAGAGFDLERARGRSVYFVATGTAIAPVRAALEVALADRSAYGALSLDHGVRSEAHLAVAAEIARWRASGVDVRVHLSAPGSNGTLRGVTVQGALRERAPQLAGAAVVAVGQPEMLESLLAEVVRLGGDPALFLTNV